jgi:uncharacterized protein (DUF427 family)
MAGYPPPITAVNHVAPAPRRVRGVLRNTTVFDTTRALYVWEAPHYPQYYVPRADVDMTLLTSSGQRMTTPQGDAQRYTLRVGDAEHNGAARLMLASPVDALRDTLRFAWQKLDHWFEEDEEIFVHPRSPYTRVDALRSTRIVRFELEGVVLAESSSPVVLFETGLPARYYLNPFDIRFEHLVPSQTRTECPYKGRTTGYWSVSVQGKVHPDLAWMYSFPTRQVLPIAGLIAFLDEKVDVFIDNVPQLRPSTHMRT